MKFSSKIMTSFLLISISAPIFSDENETALCTQNQELKLKLEQAQAKIDLYEEMLAKKSTTIIVQEGIVNIAPSAKNIDVVAFGGITNIGIVTKKNNPKLISVTSKTSGIMNVGTVVIDDSMMQEFENIFTKNAKDSNFFDSLDPKNLSKLMPNFDK